jgi:hypothetical protein
MEVRGFPPDDPLFQLVARACDVMHHLRMDLHYRTCNGVFRPTPPIAIRENTPAPDAPKRPPIGPNDRKD